MSSQCWQKQWWFLSEFVRRTWRWWFKHDGCPLQRFSHSTSFFFHNGRSGELHKHTYSFLLIISQNFRLVVFVFYKCTFWLLSASLCFLHDFSSGRCSVHVLASMFVSQERTVLQDILQREVSVVWMMPAPTLLSIIIELCLYLKEQYIVPYLYRPLKIPFILLHYCLKHKVH